MSYLSSIFTNFYPFNLNNEDVGDKSDLTGKVDKKTVASQGWGVKEGSQEEPKFERHFSTLYRQSELLFEEDAKLPLKGQPGNPIFIAAIEQYIAHPPERSNAKTAYEFAQKHWIMTHPSIIDMETLQNVGWFAENPEHSNWRHTLLGSISTMMGRVAMDGLICCPIDDESILVKRQKMLGNLKENEKLQVALSDCYQNLFAAEQQVLSFWNSNTRLPATLDAALAYAPKSAASWRLSGNYALNLTTIVSVLGRSAISTVACTALAMVEIQSLKQMVLNDESEFFGESILRGYVNYFGSYPLGRKEISGLALQILMLLPNTVIPKPALLFAMAHRNYKGFNKEISRLLRSLKLEFATYKKMMKVASYFKNIEKIYEIVRNPESEVLEGLQHFEKLEAFLQTIEVKRLLTLLQSPEYDEETLFFDRGNLLEAWKLMASNEAVRTALESALLAVGEIEAYLAVSQKIIELEGSNKICFTEFVEQQSTLLQINKFWHPSISQEKAVMNSISLGGEPGCQRAIILTGPNASGKSTLLRAVLFSIIASQSFTVGFARSLCLTPIHYMRSSMNPEDSIQNSTSLFQAQAETIAKIIQDLKDIEDPASHVFLALDELFTGTNSEEGDPLAQATLLELVKKHANVTVLAATHHTGAAKLGKTHSKTASLFRSYRLIYEEDQPKYRLERGVCERKLANVVAKQRGIPSAIINRAKQISKEGGFLVKSNFGRNAAYKKRVKITKKMTCGAK